MKKLSKEQTSRLAELQKAYTEKRDALDKAIEDANDFITKANSLTDDAFGELNEVIGELNVFREEVASAIEDYIAEKSEKWQDGERGQAFNAWHDAWQDDLEEVEYTPLDTLDPLDARNDVPEEALSEESYPREPNE